jgi:hypothetical protein
VIAIDVVTVVLDDVFVAVGVIPVSGAGRDDAGEREEIAVGFRVDVRVRVAVAVGLRVEVGVDVSVGVAEGTAYAIFSGVRSEGILAVLDESTAESEAVG